jgi:hypothetical protein
MGFEGTEVVVPDFIIGRLSNGMAPHPILEHRVPHVPTASLRCSWVRAHQGRIAGGRKLKLLIHARDDDGSGS